MTRLAAFALLALCSAGMPQAKAANQLATCTPGQTNIITAEGIRGIEIQCPTPLKLQTQPPIDGAETSQVLAAPQADDSFLRPLHTLIPGAAYILSSVTRILRIDQLPEKVVTVYFHCKAENKPEQDCFIGVTVQASGPLGPNGCAVAGSGIDFGITEKGQTALFRCGVFHTVLPDDMDAALDETCDKPVLLPNGCTFEKVTEGDYLHRFTVSDLPQKSVTVCYICVQYDDDITNKSRRCEVRIKIRGTDKSGTGSVGVAARTAAALGLILTAVVLSHSY